jgi:hypothetical protein
MVGVWQQRGRWWQHRQKVIGDVGVDVDELHARVVLLEVVVGPEVHGWRRSTVNSCVGRSGW